MSWGAVLLCFDVKEKMGMFRVIHWVFVPCCKDANRIDRVSGKRLLRMDSVEIHSPSCISSAQRRICAWSVPLRTIDWRWRAWEWRLGRAAA